MKLSPERVVLDTNNAHEHGHGVGDHLYVHRHSLVHDLPAQVKTVAATIPQSVRGISNSCAPLSTRRRMRAIGSR